MATHSKPFPLEGSTTPPQTHHQTSRTRSITCDKQKGGGSCNTQIFTPHTPSSTASRSTAYETPTTPPTTFTITITASIVATSHIFVSQSCRRGRTYTPPPPSRNPKPFATVWFKNRKRGASTECLAVEEVIYIYLLFQYVSWTSCVMSRWGCYLVRCMYPRHAHGGTLLPRQPPKKKTKK